MVCPSKIRPMDCKAEKMMTHKFEFDKRGPITDQYHDWDMGDKESYSHLTQEKQCTDGWLDRLINR